MASVSTVDANVPVTAALEDSLENSLVLPAFIMQRPEGMFIDLTRLESESELARIIERIFSTAHFLRGLDYSCLQRLLYDYESARQGLLEIRLAAEIVEFPLARRALYRPVKIDGDAAVYIFEPVELESTVEVPLYSTDDDGNETVIGVEQREVFEKAHLDFDEFVADLWKKGVRFGIDAEKVRDLIQSGRTERVVVATALAPTESTDAGIEEQTEALHRSNKPRTLTDGRIDLSQFTNRFPQISQGALLLLKTPRQLGKAGRRLDGKRVEARLPQDFELSALAGEGTKIEKHGEHEYIVSAINGFLNLDTKTNQLSVTEKIINREGVSARTTGNLALQGNAYEEFGEVQEGRSVEGRNLTFHANVFGKVASAGGLVLLEKNLVGGMALNRDGEIVVLGLASSAHLQLGRGVIRLKRAENCVLIADRVEVDWACQCVVLAEEVEIAEAEGCSIAGKRVHVAVAKSGSSDETLISMLLPDLSGFERSQAKELSYIEECNEMIGQLKQGLAVMTSQPELQQYLVTAGKLRRKELALAPEQQGDWQQQVARMAPAMKRIGQAREDIQALEAEITVVHERIAQLEAEKIRAGEGVECSLDQVAGDTRVRTMIVLHGSTPMARLPPKELKAKLRGLSAGEERLFGDDSGSFIWKHQPAG